MYKSNNFKCDQCGLCCRSVGSSSAYQDLDRGDGVCRYFQDDTNLCNIYYKRPLRCNIDEYYNTYLQDKMTKEEFFHMNYQECNKLKKSIIN